MYDFAFKDAIFFFYLESFHLLLVVFCIVLSQMCFVVLLCIEFDMVIM
jgi:hypothetical protein